MTLPSGVENTNEGTNAVREKVRDFLMAQFPALGVQGIAYSDLLHEGGIIDSFGILDVATFVESDFGVNFDPEDLIPENFASINTLSIFIEKKMQRGS